MTSGRRALWLNPKLLLGLFLVFFAGALLGALLMRVGTHTLARKPELYWQEGGKQVTLARLTRELDLTAAQQQQMETTLDDFAMYMQMLQEQMSDVRAHGKDRILRVLNEEQKKKFEKLLGELQQARTNFGE